MTEEGSAPGAPAPRSAPAGPPSGRPGRRERPPRPAAGPRPPRLHRGDPVVYVGDRPLMTYVFEVLGQFHSGVNEVKVKARGRAISRAVDVAEVVRRHRLLEGQVKVGPVTIGTEHLTTEGGKPLNVSSLEIVLVRTAPALTPTTPASAGAPTAATPSSPPSRPPGAAGTG